MYAIVLVHGNGTLYLWDASVLLTYSRGTATIAQLKAKYPKDDFKLLLLDDTTLELLMRRT